MSTEQPPGLFIPDDNRPRPLEDPPIPLFGEGLSQMSFGERAALEGLLGQLKPRLALEIGTYDGGSLRFLARHCELVHTLDLYDLVGEHTRYPNVTFHIGDSKSLLPALLSELKSQRLQIDFALVDGDHSADGVMRDLLNLLDSPASASTVILLHDTMSEETRAGIEAAGPAAHPGVVYYDLDFVPGYEFAGGHFDGEAWGGLGLVITGDRASQGYGASPRQTLYRQAFEFRSQAIGQLAEARRLARELAELQDAADRSRSSLTAIESSLSWRMTDPLRRSKRAVLRRLRG